MGNKYTDKCSPFYTPCKDDYFFIFFTLFFEFLYFPIQPMCPAMGDNLKLMTYNLTILFTVYNFT